MPLSNAERQRRWREKQKEKDPEGFRKKDAKRKRESYIRTELLKPKELKDRRENTRAKVKRHYYKQKQKNQGDKNSQTTNENRNKLIVKLNLMNVNRSYKGNGLRKTYRHSLRKAYRKNDELTRKNEELQKMTKKLQKRLERTKKHQNQKGINLSSAENETPGSDSLMTPRSKTKTEIQNLGLPKI
jgi:hypothetical protein